MPKNFYSVKEASKILSVSTNTIYKYLDEGSLKGKRLSGRGRFKIPYSEIAPYLAQEVSTNATVTEVAQDDQKGDQKNGVKLTFSELWLGGLSVGAIVIFFLWNFGQGTPGSQASLVTDIGNAVLEYSGRTFSGFGNLISHVLPAQITTNIAQVSDEEVKEPGAVAAVSDSKAAVPDFNLKLQESQRKSYELYADVQVLASNTQKLLSQSRTLTATELNESISGMSQLLGSVSDLPDQKTIFAEINWLDEAWSFPTVEAVKRSASQVSFILNSLSQKSLGAFTKPQPADLNDLVNETEALQGFVGNNSDSSTDTTLYGSIKGVEFFAKTLDAKGKEIDKILESWDGYNIFEKENNVKTILSETLRINTLPKIDEVVFAKPSGQGGDTELKNTLLSTKGVLEANRTHLAQPSGQPVLATWLESDGSYFKVLIVNPSATIAQETALKYYLPANLKRKDISQIDEGLTLNLDSEKNQYFIEVNQPLAAGAAKTLGLIIGGSENVAQKNVVVEKAPQVEPPMVLGEVPSVVKSKPADTVVTPVMQKEITVTPTKPPANIGQVAGVKTISYPTQRTAVWGLIIAFIISGLVLLAIYLRKTLGRGVKKPQQEGSDLKETSILLPEDKSNVDGVVVAPGHSHASFSFPRIEFRAIRKILVSVKMGIQAFLTSIRKLVVSAVTALKKGLFSTLGAIKTLFANIVSAIKKFLLSIKNGFIAILVSIENLVLKVLISIKNFIISLITAAKNFIVSIAVSLKRGFLAVIHAIKKFLLAIKNGFMAILTSIAAFISRLASSIRNLAISIITGLVSFIVAVVNSLHKAILAFAHAITIFFVNTVKAIKKFLLSIKNGFIAILVSIATFILKVITSIKKFFTSLIIAARNFVVSTALSIKKFFLIVINAIKTFLVRTVSSIMTFLTNIIFAVAKTILAVFNTIQKVLISGAAFILRATSRTVKALTSVIKRVLKALTSLTRATDSVLSRLDFDSSSRPKLSSNSVRGLRLRSRALATLILISVTSTIISSVLALTVMARSASGSSASQVTENGSTDVTRQKVVAPPEERKVTIGDTETGWLRVRATPSGGEIGKVLPGETYKLLDTK